MNKYIVTFGLQCSWLCKRYIVVEAETDDDVRRILENQKLLDVAANIYNEVIGMQIVARNRYHILDK